MESDSKKFLLTGTVAGAVRAAVVSSEGLTVGRNPDCGLTVADPEVSRSHCVVRIADGKVTVENRSQNGTSVNGTLISAVTEIKVGDVLKIGSTELSLREAEVQAAPTAAPAPEPAPAPAPAPEPAPIEVPNFQPGDMVDRYRIKRLIGKGGMGTVYEVLHTGLDLPRALKALTLPNDPAYAAFRDKFLDEGKMLARLHHENVTQVYDAAYDEKTRTLFFVMDLVLYDDGKPCTLADVAYDECDVNAWFAALASALDYVHAQGIVHSDIKLQNVLVSAGQKIKLADFGVAHLLSGKMRASLHGGEKSGEKETIGYTAHYVSPEILKANALPSAASDVYALGVMLVRLLSGKWYDEHPEVLDEIAAKRALNWRPILVQMLAADPKRRVTNLMSLVLQLRKGSNATARRKYQIENRRRRSQKVRLQRAVNLNTSGVLSAPLTPEPKRSKLIPLLAGVGALAILAGAFIWINRSNAAKEAAEQARIEKLNETRAGYVWKMRKSTDELKERVKAVQGEIKQQRCDFDFVSKLSRRNMTTSVDKALAERRNTVILRYADVLKSQGDVRTVLTEYARSADGYGDRLDACRDGDAMRAVVDDFDVKLKSNTMALDRVTASERQKWDLYAKARVQLEEDLRTRKRISGARDRALESVQQMLESVAELKAAPEYAKAQALIDEADRLSLEDPSGVDRVAKRYEVACAVLSNGCARLRRESSTLSALEKSFRESDEAIRKTDLAKMRRGECSLKDVAAHAKELSVRFTERWKPSSAEEATGLVERCSFALEAQRYYLAYLANVLNRSHGDVAFATTEKGIRVTKRYSYDFSWNAVFAQKKQDTKAKDSYVQMIVDFCNVPKTVRCGQRSLAGRWIFMKECMPSANDAEQARRLTALIEADGPSRALEWLRLELPPTPAPAAVASTNELPDEVSSTNEPPVEAETPAEKRSARSKPVAVNRNIGQERVVLFTPSQGLSLKAIARTGIELSRCQKSRRPRHIYFAVSEGEIAIAGAASGRSSAEVEEGKSFDVHYPTIQGFCRYWPLAWIDNALGDGSPLLLLRCQYFPPAQ